MPNPNELLTTAQVAARIGRNVRTVARWVEAGRLAPVHRLPGSTGAMLFDPEDVDRVAEEQVA